ncbi:UNVERIFIED_CONTAM: Neuronal acetylcholine receptor subunit alpha-7 [Gekko kuhli]
MGLRELSVVLIIAGGLVHVSLQGEFQRKLYKELLKNYNPLERPVANDSQPLTVSFGLSLMQIMDVSPLKLTDTTEIGQGSLPVPLEPFLECQASKGFGRRSDCVS